MLKFRKKPIEIEAWQIPPADDEQTRANPPWLISAVIDGTVTPLEQGGVIIKTLEGDHRGNVGDWIIRGVKGEMYPCRDDIFRMTYEEVPEDATYVPAASKALSIEISDEDAADRKSVV